MREAWTRRINTLAAMAALSAAKVLVTMVRFSRWRATLGSPSRTPAPKESQPTVCAPVDRLRAVRIARHVLRAAKRLPIRTNCLPRAVATQWLLRARRISGTLVIAVHMTDRSSEDAFHAWVEHEGEMIIGHCDRRSYRPVMSFSVRGGKTTAPAPVTPAGS